ncbi:MAG: hypothetical protein NTY77_08770 [Elusimicrobia bacterium]|nr:hypothetical protein [Elusimicrobiota bacterium]
MSHESMKTSIFLLAAISLPRSLQAAMAPCSFPSEPTIIERTDSGPNPILLQYWDFDSDRILFLKSPPDSKRLAEYRETVAKRITTDPTALLKRYMALQPAPEDLHNIEVVMSRPGSIKEIGCLAGLLLEIQISRNERFATDAPEFIAYFLQKKGKLRAYFLTNDSRGIRGAGFSDLLSRIDADRDGGWKVLANLHNHSFFLNDLDSRKPQGVLAPSANDIQVFSAQIERFGLKGAYITNGFNTLYVPGQDIKRYASAK